VPVVENFTVSAQTTVVVSGVRSDDHGNDPGTASLLNTDNLDQWGHIEQPGDRDLFRITVAQDMTIVVRVTDLAAGMQPRLRLLAGMGRRQYQHYRWRRTIRRWCTRRGQAA